MDCKDAIMERHLPRLEAALTPARLRHSLGVMQVMGELASVYGLDREQAMTAGLLHDAAIVYSPSGTYVLVIMTDGSSWAEIAALTRKIEELRG